jgi:hypothetical protein
MFLNDAYGDIEKNPDQVIKNILDAMNNISKQSKTYSIGYFSNSMETIVSAHADIPRIYMTWQNMFIELGVPNNTICDAKLRKTTLKIAKNIIKREAEIIKELESRV